MDDEHIEDIEDNDLPKGRYKDGWSEENWSEEMKNHPIFMNELPQDASDLPPLVEAMQQLKYDPDMNTSNELALSYKEDGNENFKYKKYRWAIDSYTEGIKQNCDDNELNSALYGNRAAAHFHLGKYWDSLKDAEKSFSLNSKNIKALNRWAKCLFELKKFQECVDLCQKHPKNETLEKLEKQAKIELKKKDRDKRKQENEMKKRKEMQEKIVNAVNKRGIKFEGSLFEPRDPAAAGHHVVIENEELIWPVIFLYPEYGQSDFIERFNENDTFMDHLKVMFGDESVSPAWDVKQKYKTHKISVKFISPTSGSFVDVNVDHSLKEVLCDNRFVLVSSIPTFILTAGEKKFMTR